MVINSNTNIFIINNINEEMTVQLEKLKTLSEDLQTSGKISRFFNTLKELSEKTWKSSNEILELLNEEKISDNPKE